MSNYRPSITDPDTVKAMEGELSDSDSPHLRTILQGRLSRRDTLRGGFGLAVTTIFAGSGLSACSDGSDSAGSGGPVPAELGFDAIPGSSADRVVVPAGYRADVLLPWGTPITGSFPAFDPANNTAADQAQQVGMHHDGMHFFPLPRDTESSDRGLLVINHENLSRPFLFPAGRTLGANGRPTVADEVRREINAHGVSVVEIQRDSAGVWEPVQSGFNRRITGATEMLLSGPAAGSDQMVTPFSPSGTMTRGTFNNCARGFTPWGTYLTCEENLQGYFITDDANPARDKTRYGITPFGFGFFWSNLAGDPAEVDGEFARFDVSETSNGPTQDWRNESSNFGWVAEIDPFDPASMPVKRTAMGRFRHEGAQPGVVREGRAIAFYMGDDARGEYLYKFVTAEAWNPGQPDRNMLDDGTLFVARLREDGSGEWLALDIGNPALQGEFADQADLLINTRTAADIVGATPMDRPEWSTTDPDGGEIYFTLTNNSDRGDAGEEQPDAANPRPNNAYGHIIRLAEAGGDPAATAFTWDIFVFGGPAEPDPDHPDARLSGLTEANQFGSPDGLFFDRRGVLWIQTDNGGNLVSEATNDQMLAVIPARLPGDRTINPETQGSLKRFLTGPVGCEVTGMAFAPDFRSMFVNVQHPSMDWPDGAGNPPRSATVVITREDGGEIAL